MQHPIWFKIDKQNAVRKNAVSVDLKLQNLALSSLIQKDFHLLFNSFLNHAMALQNFLNCFI